jgi:hypothetical protein
MNEEILRIQKMVAAGTVTPEEAAELIESIRSGGSGGSSAATSPGGSSPATGPAQFVAPPSVAPSGRRRPISLAAGILLFILGCAVLIFGLLAAAWMRHS